MMTLDEAIYHCREVAIEYEAKGECYECGKEHRQLAEWLQDYKQLKDMTRWIPCSERMPKPDEMVLVCCYGSDIIIPDYSRGENIEEAIQRISEMPHVTIGFCDDEGWCGADCFPMMLQPKFWMQLPDPPERSNV